MFPDMSDEEFNEFEQMDDEAIDTAVHEARQQIIAIEWQKKFRQSPFERRIARSYETEDMTKLSIDNSKKIVIDKVPPRVRKTLARRNSQDAE